MRLVRQVLCYQFTTSLPLYYHFTTNYRFTTSLLEVSCFSGAKVQILTRHLGGPRRAARGRRWGTPRMTEAGRKRVRRGVPGGVLVLGV